MPEGKQSMAEAGEFAFSVDSGESAFASACIEVGHMLSTPIEDELDLVRIARKGVSPEQLDVLVDRGFARRELNWIVPARRLTHRRRKNEHLTVGETDRLLRAMKIQAMAEEAVLGNPLKALSWLRKPRGAFDGMSAMELIRTEAGRQLVEEALGQLDEGYFA